MDCKYIIITPVKDEEKYIKKLVKSVCNQRLMPEEWIVVSDGSTDKTNELLVNYSKDIEFLNFQYLSHNNSRNMSSRTQAVCYGYKKRKVENFKFIAILDADIEIQEDYYLELVKCFQNNPKLGLAGGLVMDISEERTKGRAARSHNLKHVAGGVQMFRRECYELIGGYTALKWGADDTLAEYLLNMKGWKTKTFLNIQAIHSGIPGESGRYKILKQRFVEGIREYSIGTHPLFFFLKQILRLRQRPVLFTFFIRYFGYFWGLVTKQERFPIDVRYYIRRNQMERLMKMLKF